MTQNVKCLNGTAFPEEDCHRGMLTESWKLWGIQMAQYHTLFFLFSVGVMVTCVLLVMVPAVGSSKSLP